MPAGLLFDMDGTLTDSEALWFAAEKELFAELGYDWVDGMQYDIIGMSMADATRFLVQKLGLDIAPAELGQELTARVVALGKKHGMPWLPGALELLQNSVAWGIPSALVTSSMPAFAELTLANAPAGALTVCVTGDRTRGKPHPDPYLLAAAELDVAPELCVTFEDSIPGLQSAVAAGTKAVAVPCQVKLPDIPGVTYIDSLTEVDADFLAARLS
ncbi:MAG: HAD family phosphatase [Trueperella sp.]|nr:HAD family phosphatase [Trueperella sp.]